MRKYLIAGLIFFTIILTNASWVKAVDIPGNVVATDHQMYTYAEMIEDINLLASKYPGIISVTSMGTSSYGRNIPAVIIGNPNASKKVLVQSTIHAREYMCTQVTMEIAEYICDNYYSKDVNGILYSELFSNVCFHLIPMVNPDGVEISQRGYDGATNDATKGWLKSQVAVGAKMARIKSNANGVDLNRNFPVGFGTDKDQKLSPCFELYPGATALDQAETYKLSQYTSKGFYAFINYHSCGQIIYYGSAVNTPENAARSQALAGILSGYNRYKLVYEPQTKPAYGSFSDYVQKTYDRPSATMEIGTVTPTPISQFKKIFDANKDSWGGVAYAIYSGQF
ncbi:MAG: hypothetical protein E7305_06440 [Butyrivibrio sp.]|nr:hypothetical protein [Butyrivibrio sp.]